MLLRAWLFLAVCLTVHAHVQLLYPPATLNLDFLDTFRTKGICGHVPSGVERTSEWKLPLYDADTVTEFQTGSNVTVSWLLHYAHQGGWLFELYNAEGELTSTWNSSNHWDCVSDSTQQTATLTMPETPCKGCILRLRRQALEWGSSYRFHSCAQVNVIESVEKCNGCSGRGKCVKGVCKCDRSVKKGFWYGDYCEKQDECDEDEHCGEGGVCVDSGNITPPGKQCYCKTGWWGPEVKPIRGSYISSRNCNKKTKMELGDPEKWADAYNFELKSVPEGNFKLYYSIDTDKEEIEFAIRAKTKNWAAIGFRPIANGERPTLDDVVAVGSEEAPELESGLEDVEVDVDGEGDEKEEESKGEGDEKEESKGEGDEKEESKGEGDEKEEDETETGGEGDGSRRRLLDTTKRMPMIQREASSRSLSVDRSLMQAKDDEPEEDDTKDEDKDSDGEGGDDKKKDDDSDSDGEGGDDKKKDDDSDSDGEGGDDKDKESGGEGEEEDSDAEGGDDKDKESGGEGDEEESGGEGDEEESGGEGDEEESGGEGDGDDDEFCKAGKPTTTLYDEGVHDLASTKRRRLQSMPSLQSEKTEISTSGRSLKQKKDKDKEEESDSEGGEEKDSDGEGGKKEKDEDEESDSEGGEEKESDGEGGKKEKDEEEESDSEGGEEKESDGEGGKKEKDEDEESDSEGGEEEDSDGEGGEEEDEEDEEDIFVPELIGFGTECQNVATTDDAHPMINQDIYVVYGKDGMFRIQDSFTPSRAKPLPDVYYGGEDGIIDAIGEQDGDYTNIKFRRKLSTVDAFADYCILEDVDYFLVYAYGQPEGNYTHIPDSGLETGRSSNKEFYGEDELKFHGGGIRASYEGRGIFGAVNFFEEPKEVTEGGDCIESDLDDYDCMQEELGGDYVIHWSIEDDGVAFACQTTGTGWVGIGWPKTPGVMVGTHAVIGLGGKYDSVIVFELTSKAPSGIIESNAFEIKDASIEHTDDSSMMKFKRMFDDDFTGEGEVDLVIAYHSDSNEVEYHGSTNKKGITIAFS